MSGLDPALHLWAPAPGQHMFFDVLLIAVKNGAWQDEAAASEIPTSPEARLAHTAPVAARRQPLYFKYQLLDDSQMCGEYFWPRSLAACLIHNKIPGGKKRAVCELISPTEITCQDISIFHHMFCSLHSSSVLVHCNR